MGQSISYRWIELVLQFTETTFLINMLYDAETGIAHRENTFDSWIIGETRSYFPLGLTPQDIVLDLGGHIGAFASRAMMECPEITLSSIEAEQTNFQVLEQNSQKFGFDVVHGAIVNDDMDGKPITLYVNIQKNNAAHSILQTRGRAEQSVTGIGFSRVMDNFHPTVIKCDIEGADYYALRGANKIIEANHPTVICDVYEKPPDPKKLRGDCLERIKATKIVCTKNHFDVADGETCKRCGEVIRRDRMGREENRPEDIVE